MYGRKPQCSSFLQYAWFKAPSNLSSTPLKAFKIAPLEIFLSDQRPRTCYFMVSYVAITPLFVIHVHCRLAVMAVGHAIRGVDKACVRFAASSQYPTGDVTHFDGGACRVAAVSALGARFGGKMGTSDGRGAEKADDSEDLLEHCGGLWCD
jgi:hypothetical protein